MRMSGVAAIALSLLAAGCGTFVRTTALNPPPRTLVPRDHRLVTIFSSGPPVHPHVDVALIEVERTNDVKDTPGMIQRLRETAGAMGCDGAVIGGMRERGGQADYFDPGSTTIHATCIVYRDPPRNP